MKYLFFIMFMCLACGSPEEIVSNITNEGDVINTPEQKEPEVIELCEDKITTSYESTWLDQEYESPSGDTLKIYYDGYFEASFVSGKEINGLINKVENETQGGLHYFTYDTTVYINTDQGCMTYRCWVEKVEVSPYEGQIYIDFRDCDTSFIYGDSLRNMWKNY